MIYHRPDASVNMPAQKRWMSAVSAIRWPKNHCSARLGVRRRGPSLRAMLNASCHYYGNGLGPDYNAAHAKRPSSWNAGLACVSLKHKRLPCVRYNVTCFTKT
ncbi:hypothetical protein KCP76_15665 [Salmonella enterica subsp. enterica serovar Weltevreden]|nr:hypothetical protein KCP76_15665 [Salmonella enterica subsp. enterica serovar Weltevreden]